MSGHIAHWDRWIRPGSRWPNKQEPQQLDEARKITLQVARIRGQGHLERSVVVR